MNDCCCCCCCLQVRNRPCLCLVTPNLRTGTSDAHAFRVQKANSPPVVSCVCFIISIDGASRLTNENTSVSNCVCFPACVCFLSLLPTPPSLKKHKRNSLQHTDYVRDVFLLLNEPETGNGGKKRRDILMFLRELFNMAKTLQASASLPSSCSLSSSASRLTLCLGTVGINHIC